MYMQTMWGLHNNRPELDLIANEFVSIGWHTLGDLSAGEDDKEQMKARVAEGVPGIKLGAVPNAAGVILKFAFRMKQGDLVIYPYKPDSTLNFGRVESDYYHESSAPMHRNRRKVKWLKTGIPRTNFSQAARHELGAAITLFGVKRHASEFRHLP